MSNWKWCVQDNDGKVVKGWYEDNGKWYYLNNEGIMATGWVQLDNKWYYLNSCGYDAESGLNNGQMLTGWIQIDGKWFYLNPKEYDSNTGMSKGEMLIGWIQLNNEWYYLNPKEYDGSTGLNKGEMLANTTAVIDSKSYTFGKDGAIKNNSATIPDGSLISNDCLCFIKGWEGFIDNGKKYYDCCCVLTQGYGMTGDEIADLPDQITEEVAASMLCTLVDKKYAVPIKSNLDNKGISVQQNQFDALVTFAYNVGVGALFASTLYKNVCNGMTDSTIILGNFQAWSKGEVDGRMQTIEGLLKRRNAEATIFINGDYSARP